MSRKIKSEMKLIDDEAKNHPLSINASNVENSLPIKEIDVPIINSVEFCSNILSRNGLGVSLHIDRFKSYEDIATTEIKCLLNSRNDLMKLLCTFPLIFHVEGYEVTLRNWIIFHLNQQEWLKELMPDSVYLLPIYISTIQFYCNELFKITPMFELPIHQLFSHKSKAPEAIQAVTRNIKEFVLFLKLYPKIFHFKGDKVLLSKSALSYRNLKMWVRRLMVGDFTFAKHIKEETAVNFTHSGIKFYEVLKNEVAVYEAVGFHYKIVLTNGSVKGISLQKLFNRNNKVVPMSTFIKNLMDFEIFLTSYPEVFTLINKTVFLTQLHENVLHNKFTSESDDQLNCSISKEDGFGLKNNNQTVISFYLGLLNNISNMPGKITEFPISHLVYYNVIAPPEVRKIAKNVKELKNFLSQYPQFFKINGSDNIVFDETDASLGSDGILSPIICSNIVDKKIFEEKLKETISFYTNVIYELGCTAKIEQLLDYGWQTCKEIQSITTNFKDLKNFFCTQQDDFTVVDDCVSLKNKHEGGDFVEVKSPTIFSKMSATKNAINFYSNVLKKHSTPVVSLIKISGHRGSAPSDVQSVAKNPKELKIFFSQFPEIFTIVDGNEVMLSKPCEKIMTIQHQQQIFTSEMFCESSEQEAVEFFSKMLNNYGICRVLSINKLFEFKLKSSPSIQKISGSNINQFLAFLSKYPQEFFVTNDNVIARKKIPKWTYSGKYEDKKFTDPLLLLVFNFFKMYTSNKSLFHIDHLYNNVGRFFSYNNEMPLFPTKCDLLLFLGLYPHIFFVDYYRIVNVIASSRKAFVSGIERRQTKKNPNKPKISSAIETETLKPIVTTLKSSQKILLTSLDTETKQSSNVNEESSYKIETNKKVSIKFKTPKQPKKGLIIREKNKKKTKTNTFQSVERSFSEESLLSELSKNFDAEKELELNSSKVLQLGDHLWDNHYSPYQSNDNERKFNPLKIEEIENSICSHFIGQINKKKHLPKNDNNLLLPFDGKILNDSFKHIVSSIFLKDFSIGENFDDFITKALIFLNGKLWENGNLNIIKIEELFSSFSQTILEISDCCCKSVKEFKNFLCQFPDHFIISQNKVMARKNKILDVSYLLNNKEESLPIVMFHFLNLYTKHFNYIFLKRFYSQIGKYFCNINRLPFFKCIGDLVMFLEMFPEVFVIENNQIINLSAPKVYQGLHKVKFNSGVIKIDSFLDKKLYSTILTEKYPTALESTEGWKDYVLERTQIVEDLGICRVVTTEILNSQKIIALDCEGVNLGAAGRLTLVQIGLISGQVYIFDIVKETSLVNEGGLKNILESESILKVIHDSRNDVANLYTEYGVKITPIFDTRVVHHLIVNQGQGVSPKRIPSKLTAIGFNELCSKYGANLNVQKDEMKDVYKFNPSYWMSRPLTKDMVAYAALDVASLVPQVFFTMIKLLRGIPERLLWELSGKHSLSVLYNKDLLFD